MQFFLSNWLCLLTLWNKMGTSSKSTKTNLSTISRWLEPKLMKKSQMYISIKYPFSYSSSRLSWIICLFDINLRIWATVIISKGDFQQKQWANDYILLFIQSVLDCWRMLKTYGLKAWVNTYAGWLASEINCNVIYFRFVIFSWYRSIFISWYQDVRKKSLYMNSSHQAVA